MARPRRPAPPTPWASLTNEQLVAEGFADAKEVARSLEIAVSTAYEVMHRILPSRYVGGSFRVPRVALRLYAASGLRFPVAS
jgi:hypothetical protein